MDRRLFEAAVMGNVGELHELLKEQPLLLHGVALSSADTPLHVAAMAGKVNFVKELIRLKPEFVEELNQDGFNPLHIASANGYLEIVKELLKLNHAFCQLMSKEKRTALHYAAVKGRIDIINELVSNCSECIEAMTIWKETALHLAIKNNQFEAFKVMVQKLKLLGKEGVINKKDVQGNTVLHLAIYTKQPEVVDLLLAGDTLTTGVLDVNNMNGCGLTALDILLQFPNEAGDREIEGILRGAGAMRTQDLHQVATQPENNTEALANNDTARSSQSPMDRLVDYFRFQKGRDSPSDARTALLVLAVLITTATFQAGLNPPGGIWQDNNIDINYRNVTTRHVAGKSILMTNDLISFGIFLYSNSLGFHLSLFMIYILTYRFPMNLELQICMLAMIFTYNTTMVRIGPEGSWTTGYHISSAVIPLAIPFVAKWFRQLSAKRRALRVISNRVDILSG